MPKEILRPLTHPKLNKGEPVDSLTLIFNEFYFGDSGKVVSVNHSNGVQRFDLFDRTDRLNFINELCLLKSDALNAPVKVTQAVLDAMEKMPDAKFFVDYGDRKEKVHDWHFALFDIDNEEGDSFIPIIGKRVIADCPLALQVLLQFTTEGERI